MKEKNHQNHQDHQPENEVRETRISKSDIAKMYGRSWRSFRRDVWILLPSLKGCRRRILTPFEIEKILSEFGKPEKLDSIVIE